VHECLFWRPFYLDEGGSMVVGVKTSVGSNGVVFGSGIRFHKSSKVGKRLVGFPTIAKSA